MREGGIGFLGQQRVIFVVVCDFSINRFCGERHRTKISRSRARFSIPSGESEYEDAIRLQAVAVSFIIKHCEQVLIGFASIRICHEFASDFCTAHAKSSRSFSNKRHQTFMTDFQCSQNHFCVHFFLLAMRTSPGTFQTLRVRWMMFLENILSWVDHWQRAQPFSVQERFREQHHCS
jgi:hypothetical protein